MQREIDDYITGHTSPEPEHLKELYRQTWLHRLYPQMCSGHVQGRILKMLTAMVNPKNVLELGTFTGYSALCISEALEPGARLHTIEIDDESAESLIRLFKTAPGGEKITLHIGDALEIIPTLDYVWDLVYIDANKRHYCEYLDLVLPRLRPGGFIIADNTLWGGKITEGAKDAQSIGIARFNDLVARHPELETVILPLRDGLTILRKKSE